MAQVVAADLDGDRVGIVATAVILAGSSVRAVADSLNLCDADAVEGRAAGLASGLLLSATGGLAMPGGDEVRHDGAGWTAAPSWRA